MKTLITVSIFTLSCIPVFAQQTFFYQLTAKVAANTRDTQLYVAYEIAGVKFKDSIAIGKKQFSLYKSLTQPVSASLYTNNSKVEPLSIFLANNTILVQIVNNTITVSNSAIQKDFFYLTANDRIRPGYFPLYGELSAKNDTAGLSKLAVIFDSLKNDDIQKSLLYFKANKTSLLSLYSFNRYTTFFADYSKVEKDFLLLPKWAKNSPDGKAILAKIEGAKSAQINTLAKNFVQQTPTGKKISLADFKGKYVLLDFWASWCAPCRKEHPNLIKTYEQFKNKNFEIISVSLDAENDQWIKAIAKDKITWTQVSDLKGQLNAIAIQYGVQSVPANFLINPQGVIIDKNISGEALNSKLKALIVQ